MQKRNKHTDAVGATWAFCLIAMLVGCSTATSPNKSLPDATQPMSERAKPSSTATTYSLNIVFAGPWGFVQNQDGTILVIAPSLQGHEDAHAYGLGQEATLSKGDYDGAIAGLLPVATVVPTQVNPQASGAIYTVDIAAGQVDPQKKRFIAIKLPKPKQILPMKTEPAVIIENGKPKPQNSYAVAMDLRYDITSLSGSVFTLSGTNFNFSSDAQPVGNEGFVAVGIGPDSFSMPHAAKAFQSLGKLLGLTLDLGKASDSVATSEKKVAHERWLLDNPFSDWQIFSIPGKDCKSPAILARVK